MITRSTSQDQLCLVEFKFTMFTGLRPATLLKKKTPTQMFCCEYCKFVKSNYFEEHLRPTASVTRMEYLLGVLMKKKCMISSFLRIIAKITIRKGSNKRFWQLLFFEEREYKDESNQELLVLYWFWMQHLK